MRRLILHVGPGRTGTSALQTMFARHAAALLDEGVYFPPWPEMAKAAACAVSSGNGGALAAFLFPKNDSRNHSSADGLHELSKLHQQSASCVLYSHEGMARASVDRLRELSAIAETAGYLTQAAYYVRNPLDYARSVYAHWIEIGSPKRHLFSDSDDFEARFTPPFESQLANLRQALGVSNVLVRNYDEARADLFGDFCRAVLKIPRLEGAMPWINRSRFPIA